MSKSVKFTFTSDELSEIGNALIEVQYLPIRCFDGQRHRDMCLSLAPVLYDRLKRKYTPGQDCTLKLRADEMILIHIAVQYHESTIDDAVGRLILGRIGPKLLHA